MSENNTSGDNSGISLPMSVISIIRHAITRFIAINSLFSPMVLVQSLALLASLVCAERPQTFTSFQRGIIEITAVLNTKHGLLCLHPLYRTLTMRLFI